MSEPVMVLTVNLKTLQFALAIWLFTISVVIYVTATCSRTPHTTSWESWRRPRNAPITQSLPRRRIECMLKYIMQVKPNNSLLNNNLKIEVPACPAVGDGRRSNVSDAAVFLPSRCTIWIGRWPGGRRWAGGRGGRRLQGTEPNMMTRPKVRV